MSDLAYQLSVNVTDGTHNVIRGWYLDFMGNSRIKKVANISNGRFKNVCIPGWAKYNGSRPLFIEYR
ncbi:hypothetical protein BJX64DRAFT_253694 [Aspergillus heterothallicus]